MSDRRTASQIQVKPQRVLHRDATEAPVSTVQLDSGLRILDVSQTLPELLGFDLSLEAVRDSDLEGFLAVLPDTNEAFCRLRDSMRASAAAGVPRAEELLTLPDLRMVRVDYLPLFKQSEIVGHLWAFRDNTIEVREEELRHFQADLLSQVSDGVITVDANMAISYWNQGAEQLTGCRAEDAVGRGPEEVLHFRFPNLEEEHAAWRMLAEEGTWSGELIITSPSDGLERYLSTSANILRDEDGRFNGLLAVVRDETERREMQDRLIHHAYHDLLTGLPNRMMFLRTLDAVTTRRSRDGIVYAVLFLDLDRFKLVNDSLGHHAGDALLKSLATRLKQCVRDQDIISRLGGDEFAVLLNDVNGLNGARDVADRILSALLEPFIIDGLEIFTEVSIGIVLGDEHYDLADDVVRDADAAMYQAKRAGRACYAVFDQTQQMQANARFQLETDLRRAIERNELRVFYQPIVDIQEGRLWGFEALIRWHHRQRGLISPDQFLPVAEETGLIIDLDHWLWQESVEQLARWDAEFGNDVPLTLSINCSNRGFHDPELIPFIEEILLANGLSGARLAVEVTERVVIDDTRAACDKLDELRERGVTISIDDFGTGYASLSLLHSLPIDKLKIDRSFVKRMDRQDDGNEMVRTVVELAHSLGLECVAEGIETRRQLDHLQAMNCTFGQGFLFSRALDGDLCSALVSRRHEWLRQHWPRRGLKLIKSSAK